MEADQAPSNCRTCASFDFSHFNTDLQLYSGFCTCARISHIFNTDLQVYSVFCTCTLIFHIFNTDLQLSPFSRPPLFDREACAKLWIHIYIFEYFSDIQILLSYPSSILTHHKTHTTRASSYLCNCACCRTTCQLEHKNSHGYLGVILLQDI